MSKIRYLHLPVGTEPPSLGITDPFAAVLIIETNVNWQWRAKVSRWLVDSGCLYMMAWGKDCALWDDSVDYANLDDFPNGDIPEERWVMTTWHEDEPREEVLWFAQYAAQHPVATINEIVLIDIGEQDRRAALLAEFKAASDLHIRKPE